MIKIICFIFIICKNIYGSEYYFSDIKKNYHASDRYVLDKNGEILQVLRTSFDKRSLIWQNLDEVSPYLIQSLIAIEDKRFYQHFGVDFISIFGILLKGEKRGGSTLTMQLASFLNPSIRTNSKKNIIQKIKQIYFALKLEFYWSKNEILEAYLNLAPFSGELQGVSAASLALFQKTSSVLAPIEALLLTILVKSPNANPKDLARRMCFYSENIELVLPNCEELKRFVEQVFKNKPKILRNKNIAFHFSQRVLRNNKDHVLKTTLDANLQRYIEMVSKEHLVEFNSENLNNIAVLVVENKSGNVIGYSSSSFDESKSNYVDGVMAKRQAGSTLKPFIYGLGLDKKILTASSLLLDGPMAFEANLGIYAPQNYDQTYRGIVTLREALASSLNIPAIKSLKVVGVQDTLEKLKQMQFHVPFDADRYGLSLAMGTLDVSLWNLVGAYRSLANHGQWSTMHFFKETNQNLNLKKIFSPQTTFILSDILSDPIARHLTFGSNSILKRNFWSAVKTGTSKDMRDNWCLGYTQEYTVGVWAGNFNGEPMYNVNGLTGAGTIWAKLMDYLQQNKANQEFLPPDKIVKKRIKLPTKIYHIDEWYIEGTEPEDGTIEIAKSSADVKILYPLDNMNVVIDKEIPSELQKIVLKSSSESKDLYWYIDNKRLGKLNKKNFLSIKENKKYLISIKNKENQTIDKVSFNVR